MIFVFGSNLAGRHGKGAALSARMHHGARYGIGEGPTGRAYALPTCGHRFQPLPLPEIAAHVRTFLIHAKLEYPTLFQVTRVGCGLAYYKDEDIAPMFERAPPNCLFDYKWQPYLSEKTLTGEPRQFWGTF